MKYNNDPEYIRKQKVVMVYMTSTGSGVQIFDNNFLPVGADDAGIEQSICHYCTGDNCHEMHKNAIQESCRRGKPFIYECDLGLIFWVSAFFSEGRFSGALRGSGYINGGIDASAVMEKCNKAIPPKEFKRRVFAFPLGDAEKIESLAKMLLLCTESLSTGSENYHELLRLRCEQQAALSALIENLKEMYPEGSPLPGYPLEKEQQLLDSLRRGNKEDAKKYLNEILALLVFSNPNNFRYLQIRALELAVLFARTGVTSNTVTTENDTRFLKQIQNSKTIEELMGILYNMVENISGQITSFQGIPHALAMRKAEAYIKENFTRRITLREIANVAGLSPPYFSTIFKEEMGENLSKYINRVRVEKASKMLLETNLSLSDISSACCFEDQSWFSKIFKAFTGMSPGKYRSRRSRADG